MHRSLQSIPFCVVTLPSSWWTGLVTSEMKYLRAMSALPLVKRDHIDRTLQPLADGHRLVPVPCQSRCLVVALVMSHDLVELPLDVQGNRIPDLLFHAHTSRCFSVRVTHTQSVYSPSTVTHPPMCRCAAAIRHAFVSSMM